VTLVFEEPVTVAVNCLVPAVATDAAIGLIDTATPGALAVTVTAALADFVGSAMLVAVMVKVPAVLPAVYAPLEIVPPLADHVTPVLDNPVTLAVNSCAPPVASVTDTGLTEIATVGVGVVDPDNAPVAVHPPRLRIPTRRRQIPAAPKSFSRGAAAWGGGQSAHTHAKSVWGKACGIADTDASPRLRFRRFRKEECAFFRKNPRYRKCMQA
jgi:hypothetical protein